MLARVAVAEHSCHQGELQINRGSCSVPVICVMDTHLATINAGRSLDGGKDGVIKDSASSTVSGEIGMQPYIRRSGTDDSGCAHIPGVKKQN